MYLCPGARIWTRLVLFLALTEIDLTGISAVNQQPAIIVHTPVLYQYTACIISFYMHSIAF
jgi:hypothetical protein